MLQKYSTELNAIWLIIGLALVQLGYAKIDPAAYTVLSIETGTILVNAYNAFRIFLNAIKKLRDKA